MAHCRADPELDWLGDVVIDAGSTGVRIRSWRAAGCGRRHGRQGHQDDRRDDFDTGTPENSRQTKNSRSRSFPIAVELRTVLERLPASPDGILFHGPRGGRLKPDTVRNILIRDVLTPLARRFPSPPIGPGFQEGACTAFDTYFCSQCATSGVPELTVMNWLGHQAVAMVRHYFHLHDQQSQEQMARVRFVTEVGGAVPSTVSQGKEVSGRRDLCGSS